MAKFKRILLKLSGESLMGEKKYGIDEKRLGEYAQQIKEIHDMGVQIGIVIGGGNIFRGLSGAGKGFDRVKGDQMGMLATVINSLGLSSALVAAGVKARVLTAIRMEPIGEFYTKWKAIEAMEKRKPPIRIIAPGRVYRSDAVDATHSPLFHQIEGLVVDKGIRMSDLKGILELFAKKLYGEDTVVRFRPHHFPFTEPSAEMDIQCYRCHGAGCPLCKGEGWIEILGCGMVHPKVLEMSGIDPNEYSGYAFGIGLERMVMGRFKIDDIRLFYENDVRFLHQF